MKTKSDHGSIYRNLRKKCYSLRIKAGLYHISDACIGDAKFIVQPAGRERVLREKRKNVHAFIRGKVDTYWLKDNKICGKWEVPRNAAKVKYDPYLFPYFYIEDTKQPIYSAPCVLIDSTGIYACY